MVRHRNRKFKGRTVFNVIEVRDEYHEYAMFQDLSFSHAALKAATALDTFGFCQGHIIASRR